jgi:hypothetical protein
MVADLVREFDVENRLLQIRSHRPSQPYNALGLGQVESKEPPTSLTGIEDSLTSHLTDAAVQPPLRARQQIV